jgi:hypothetical protein
MPKIPAINPLLQAWLLEGPLSAQVPAYVERLRRGRYATHTSGRCLNGVAHFAHSRVRHEVLFSISFSRVQPIKSMTWRHQSGMCSGKVMWMGCWQS